MAPRSLPTARQPAAGRAHDRRHDRARPSRRTRAAIMCDTSEAFAAFIGRSPDTATAEDLRLFQLQQTQSGMQPPSINSAVSAPAFLLHSDARPAGSGAAAHRRAVPAADTGGAQRRGGDPPAGARQQRRSTSGIRYRRRPAPAKAGGAGPARPRRLSRSRSAISIPERMLLRVERGKGGKSLPLAKAGDRHAMLSPQLLELLRVWWREGAAA